MSDRACPNCGNSIPEMALSCPCGFTFLEPDAEVPAPSIVRTAVHQETVQERLDDIPDLPLEEIPEFPIEIEEKPVAKTRKVQQSVPAINDSGKTGSKKRSGAAKAAKKDSGSMARPNETMIMACPACSSRISRRAAQCPKCGTSPYDHCQICATKIVANTSPCPECGDPSPFDP